MDFGYHYHSFGTGNGRTHAEAIERKVESLESAGFEWISCMDHLWQIGLNGQPDDPFFDAYTTLPAIAALTDTVEVAALVTCPLYRNPALLGRMLTTLDHISDGRAVLGIGAGWAEHEIRAYGYDFPEISERVRRMTETIELVKKMWTEPSPVSYQGEYYDISGLRLKPKPLRDPHPPILIGGSGEQLTLRAVAEHADRWNIPSTGPDELADKLAVLEEHCDTFDRDYQEIDKTVVHWAVIGDTTADAHGRYESLKSRTDAGPAPRDDHRGLVGTPDDIVDELTRYEELGVDMFMLKVLEGDDETLNRFHTEVMGSF